MKRVTGLLLLALASLQAGAADAERGRVVFDRWCAGCHAGTNRQGGLPAGTYALEQRYRGSVPADITRRTDMKPEFVRAIVRTGVNAMPRTRKTEISDADLDNVIAWLSQPDK